jgi:hypothetical protein
MDIDVKDSTGAIEWFNNELPLCNPYLLNSKKFEPMVKIKEVQQEEELFGMDWYDPTCYATEILVLDVKYDKLKLMR